MIPCGVAVVGELLPLQPQADRIENRLLEKLCSPLMASSATLPDDPPDWPSPRIPDAIGFALTASAVFCAVVMTPCGVACDGELPLLQPQADTMPKRLLAKLCIPLIASRAVLPDEPPSATVPDAIGFALTASLTAEAPVVTVCGVVLMPGPPAKPHRVSAKPCKPVTSWPAVPWLGS